MRITTKRQMYEMMAVGHFGNAMPIWFRLDDALQSGCPYLGVRSLRVHDPIRLYHVPRASLASSLRDANAIARQDLVFSEIDYGLEQSRIIQGELMQAAWGLYLRYSFHPAPMRIALERDERHAVGLRCLLLLRRYIGDYLDELRELLDRYPGAVVEFTMFKVPVGRLQQPLLIWEVRHY